MKNWVAVSMLAVLTTPAQAEVSGATKDFVEKKRQDALERQNFSAKKIEYLKNNKDKPYIINTNVHYNLEDLEPASGNKTSKKIEPTKLKTDEKENLTEQSKPAVKNTGNLNSNTKVEIQKAPQPL